MRPRRLRFAGLRSYRGEADIDFDGLDLFAIIGDTGAGKSTILEAICLALYARQTWTGALKDLIADGADQMSVEFTFDADGHTWVARRTRRRSTTPGQDLLVSATNHVPDVNGAKEVTGRVQALLGLDFGQFTRAVIMPQGRFDELLRSTPGERNEILKSLLGLGDLEVTRAAAVVARDKVRVTDARYRERRRSQPDDPAGDLRSATQDLTDLAARRRVLTDAESALRGPTATRESTEATLGPLHHALEAVGDAPRSALGTLDDAQAAFVDLEDQRAEIRREADTAEAALQRSATELAGALAGFDDRDMLTAIRSRAVDAIGALSEDLARLSDAETRVAELATAEVPDRVDPAVVDVARRASEELDTARTRHGTAKDAARDGRTAWSRLVRARAAVDDAVRAHTDASKAAVESDIALDEAKGLAAEADTAVANAEAAVANARHLNQVAAVAAGHGPGDACPVCQRDLPDGFAAPTSTDLDNAEGDAITASKAQADLTKALDAARGRAANASADARSKAGALTRAQGDLTTAEGDARTAGVDVDTDDETGALALLTTTASAAADCVEKAEVADRGATSALGTAKTAAAVARTRHDEAVSRGAGDLERARRALDRYAKLVNDVPPGWGPPAQVSGDQVTVGLLDALAARCDGAVTAVDAATAKRTEATEAANRAETRRAQVATKVAEEVAGPARGAVEALNAHLGLIRVVAARTEAASAGLGGGEPAQPAAGLGPVASREVTSGGLTATIAAAAGAIDAAEAAAGAGAQVAAEAETAAAAATAAIEEILMTAGCADVASLHRDLGEVTTREVHAKGRMAAASDAVEAVAHIDEVLAATAPLSGDLEVLCEALGNRQFVDHLLDRREAELLAEASRRLRTLSGDRFGFVADFGIQQLSSGETRTAAALSGGERFQASLALALALVEIASRGAGSLDAVFVDEGFGALDQTALEGALESLGRVAGGGKTVALISHLQAVAEYVDTTMLVTRDDVTGSQIRTLTAADRDQLISDDIRSGLTG